MALLTIHHLSKTFPSPSGNGDPVILIDHFSMDAGQQKALRGSSGSGKTTLLHLIAGLMRPDQGEIRIHGENIATMSESKRDAFRAMHIGYVFQTFNLLQGYTVMENILLGMAFGPGMDKSRAMELIETMGLIDRKDYYPRQLSTGQQQRVAVARALANRPSLVLADEPTGNLDPHLAGVSLELIQKTCRENNASLLMVTHDREVWETFETVLDLNDINRARAERKEDSR